MLDSEVVKTSNFQGQSRAMEPRYGKHISITSVNVDSSDINSSVGLSRLLDYEDTDFWRLPDYEDTETWRRFDSWDPLRRLSSPILKIEHDERPMIPVYSREYHERGGLRGRPEYPIFPGQAMTDSTTDEIEHCERRKKLDQRYGDQIMIQPNTNTKFKALSAGKVARARKKAYRNVATKAPKILPFSPTVKRYYVEGSVNGTQVEALPDSGAGSCFISKSLVEQLHLQPVPGTERMVHLANKRIIHSPGMVQVPWTFAEEKRKHILKCWILQESTHDLVLGNSFLKATQTLTRNVQRIKSKVAAVPRRLQLQLLGNKNQRLWGYLNNNYTAAFPDTGSDAMLVSTEYAEKHGLDINTNIKTQVELGDGSTAWTSGIVRDMSWKVGGMAVQCDFHVLDNLCADVVLSNNYLFEFNVFSEYTEYLDDGTGEGHSQLCNIRLIGQYSESLNLLEEEYLKDGEYRAYSVLSYISGADRPSL